VRASAENGLSASREIVMQKLNMTASAAGRTHENDVRPIVEISQRGTFSLSCPRSKAL
jgi:hypothetical protein